MTLIVILWTLITGLPRISNDNTSPDKLFANPLPIPEFIGHIEPYPGQTIQELGRICFTLFQSKLWEAGYNDDFLEDHLVTHLRVYVDQHNISAEHVFQGIFNILITEYDDQGTRLGSYGGPIETCFEPTLAKGLHSVRVEVTTMSGVLHTYEWAFKFNA